VDYRVGVSRERGEQHAAVFTRDREQVLDQARTARHSRQQPVKTSTAGWTRKQAASSHHKKEPPSLQGGSRF
jgi:hypothetical protein